MMEEYLDILIPDIDVPYLLVDNSVHRCEMLTMRTG